MLCRQSTLEHLDNLPLALADLSAIDPHWVLVFAHRSWCTDALFQELKAAFPDALLTGCSTAGEISSEGVTDERLVLTAVHFHQQPPLAMCTELASMEDSYAAGQRIGTELSKQELGGIFVLGQGVHINGSALVSGIAAHVPYGTPIVGGLAGDGAAFEQTIVLTNKGFSTSAIASIGFPKSVKVQHGSYGGWKPFGPSRTVTKCQGNVLLELDGEPALEVYKRYLGVYAKDLPASGLLFPFEVVSNTDNAGIVRTILAVDEQAGSLVLAGDIIAGEQLKLMHASTDSLVEGAEKAAELTSSASISQASLSILVSCVGRKLVMGGRVDEEVEAVAEHFGKNTTVCGFYSYGEISPNGTLATCKLHNQTMTISLLAE